MDDTNQLQRKRRITYSATDEGIERAKKALIRQGFSSKSAFAHSIFLSRSTITKFFGGKAIQLDSFKKICKELQLSDWQEIAGIKEPLKRLNKPKSENESKNADKNLNQLNSPSAKVPFSIAGSIDRKDIAKLKSIISLLRKLAKDDLIEVFDQS